MKVLALAASLLAALPVAFADFSIYHVDVPRMEKVTGYTRAWDVWQVYPVTPNNTIDCDSVRGWWWRTKSDISQTDGVRCEILLGMLCRREADAEMIKELEFNTGTGPHFTYYLKRDGKQGPLYDAHDNQIGHCTLVPNNPTFTCLNDGLRYFGSALVTHILGTRTLDCVSKLTPDDINSHRPERGYDHYVNAD